MAREPLARTHLTADEDLIGLGIYCQHLLLDKPGLPPEFIVARLRSWHALVLNAGRGAQGSGSPE